jgi:hypothetical protein
LPIDGCGAGVVSCVEVGVGTVQRSRAEGAGEARQDIRVTRQPPERGLTYALYGGACCTTCCCCCCCCAHSVGGVVGAFVAQASSQKVRTAPGALAARLFYWPTLAVLVAACTLVLSTSNDIEGVLAFPLTIVALPALQLVASLLVALRLMVLPAHDRPVLWDRLVRMTVYGLSGAAIGAALMVLVLLMGSL